uniref:Uncharacterized protein n=1 Tax=Rhizophora mucronata TaxID=61149 RepID=A0A2P2MX07_RHIMU
MWNIAFCSVGPWNAIQRENMCYHSTYALEDPNSVC